MPHATPGLLALIADCVTDYTMCRLLGRGNMGVWPRKGAYFLHPLKSRWIFLFPREQKKRFCRVGHAMNCFLLPSLTYALFVCLFFFLDGRMERKGGTRAEKTFYIFFWVITPSLFNRTEQEERGQTGRIWALTLLSYNHHIISFFSSVGWLRLLLRVVDIIIMALPSTYV